MSVSGLRAQAAGAIITNPGVTRGGGGKNKKRNKKPPQCLLKDQIIRRENDNLFGTDYQECQDNFYLQPQLTLIQVGLNDSKSNLTNWFLFSGQGGGVKKINPAQIRRFFPNRLI